jgi:hypothetical protein
MKYTDEMYVLVNQRQSDMEAGMLPFVLYLGARLAVAQEVLGHLHLTAGQSVDRFVYRNVIQKNYENLTSEIMEGAGHGGA